MHICFTDDQAILQESVVQVFRRLEGRLPTWSLFAQMSWLGLTLDEVLGGSGQGVVEACIVAEQMGRAGPSVICSSAVARQPMLPFSTPWGCG